MTIRLEPRAHAPAWWVLAVPVASVLVALAVTALVLVVSGHDPVSTYQQMIAASFMNSGALTGTLVSTTPILFTGLAAAVAFRMRVWNIGGEGQLYMGAVAATGVGLLLGDEPAPIVIASMVLAGMVGGAAWAAIPGVLKARFSTNEILTSLMLNYVAGSLLYYLIYDSTSYWRDLTTPSAKVFPTGKTLAAAGSWPSIATSGASIPFGLMVGVAIALLLWGMLRSTRFGFEIRLFAESAGAARYAGISTSRKILQVMLLSGALAGLAGASQIGDFSHVLDPRGLQQASYGYAGIVVAALALYEPVAVLVTSLFMGALIGAGFSLQGPDFPAGLVGTMQGIILFCVLGTQVLARYRITVSGRRPGEPARPADVSEDRRLAVTTRSDP